MKKAITLLAFCLTISLHIFSQEIDMQSCFTGILGSTTAHCSSPAGFFPSDSAFPPIQAGVPVVDTLYFTNFDSVVFSGSSIIIDSLTIDSIYLPDGLCWTTGTPNNTFSAGQNQGIFISGTTNDSAGQYKIRVIVSMFLSGIPLNDINLEEYTGLVYRIRLACDTGSCPPIDNSSADSASVYIPYGAGCTLGELSVAIATGTGGNNICVGSSLELTANTNTGSAYQWSTGETTQSIDIDSAGYYSVTVTYGPLTASAGINAGTSVPPTADFTLQSDSTPHVWDIVNECTGIGLTYDWTWGDGTTTTTTNPATSHTYDTAGDYNICVLIYDSLGCSASYCDSNVYLFKDQSGQMIQVNVLQYPAGITTLSAPPISLSYYAGAVHFSEAILIPTDIRLYDMSGREVMAYNKFTGSQMSIPSTTSSGVYAISLRNDNYILSQKLVILH